MTFALSTNWCNRRYATGEEIADKALQLGFDALELGFHTTEDQVAGFRRRLDQMPVGSVHAFCPVPLSAPQGYPELYALATQDEDARALARFHVTRNIRFAAEMGARTVVLHAGRVPFATFFRRGLASGVLRSALMAAKGDLNNPAYVKLLARAQRVRRVRGQRLLPVFQAELARLVPELERNGVVLALENLPYLEGFPDEAELCQLMAALAGAPIRGWFDTGHHRVRASHGWVAGGFSPARLTAATCRGMHLNDVVDFHDDHLPPGQGKVDFAALAGPAREMEHLVIEPNADVSEADLARGLVHIRRVWKA